MTSKLKCPYCGEDFVQFGTNLGCIKCDNTENMWGTKELWQALIQAKQDLEIVVDALKPFADRDNWDFEHCFVDNPQLLAGTALEQIEHKE